MKIWRQDLSYCKSSNELYNKNFGFHRWILGCSIQCKQTYLHYESIFIELTQKFSSPVRSCQLATFPTFLVKLYQVSETKADIRTFCFDTKKSLSIILDGDLVGLGYLLCPVNWYWSSNFVNFNENFADI